MKFFQTSSPCYKKHTFCNRFDRFRKVEKIMMTDRAIPPGDCGGEIQAQLQAMAEEIVSRITALDAPVSTEQLLGGLVSELFLTAAKERQRAERRRRQAEGIAEAKAKGVRFGPSPKPLPGNFESCCKAWRGPPFGGRSCAGSRPEAAPAETDCGPKDRARMDVRRMSC